MSADNSVPENIDELDDRITRPPPFVVESVSKRVGRYIVLGAGGKMGFHVSRMLQRALKAAGRSDSVTVVSRFSDPESRQRFADLDFNVIAADLSDPAQVESLPAAENVVFLAGVKFGTADDPQVLRRMNVEMPELVADRYRHSAIVALSTGCVYSFTTPESGGSNECSTTDPPGDYARSCLGREAAFIDGSSRHGTECAIVRLNYSNDLRYGVLVDIATRVLNERAIDLRTGYVNLIWQGDAVAQILGCFSHAQSPPFVVNVTGKQTLSVRELAEECATRLERIPRLANQEFPTAWLSNSACACRLFGDPVVEIDQMIDWTCEWVRQERETLNKPTHFQVRDGVYE